MLTWADWFKAAGVDGVDVSRGLRFNSADHASMPRAACAHALFPHVARRGFSQSTVSTVSHQRVDWRQVHRAGGMGPHVQP
jgi:hypothetical protein